MSRLPGPLGRDPYSNSRRYSGLLGQGYIPGPIGRGPVGIDDWEDFDEDAYVARRVPPSTIALAENELPKLGGDRVLYTNPPHTNPSKRLIYVNGIANDPAGFKESCEMLCRMTNCEVLGVFNQTGVGQEPKVSTKSGRFVADRLHKLQRGGYRVGAGVFDALQSINDWLGVGIRGLGWEGELLNGCAKSVYELLREKGAGWPGTPICIVAHSQGNLIVSNALMYYSARARKEGFKAPNIHVFAVASPAPSFPTKESFDERDPREGRISVSNYWHLTDPVPNLFAMGRNRRASKKGQGWITERKGLLQGRHFVKYYLEQTEDRRLIDDIGKMMQIDSGSDWIPPNPDQG